MASQGNPQTWVPFDNIKDCSQGFCSLYCPQWCYFIFPPPPPFGFEEEDSKTNFSPLVIAIIGTLASAFLLVSYYTVISKYCGSLDSLLRRGRRSSHSEEPNENQNPSNNEAWQASAPGLDEDLIKSITVCKYKKGDGFVEGTDCSVCLSEFQEGENLRLLPKCSHAFHLPCIDTWLKSHSNCPLCRANVVSSASPLPVQFLLPVQESPPDTSPSQENQPSNHTAVAVEEVGVIRSCDEASDVAPKTPTEAADDDREEYLEERDTIIEIREERVQPTRRSHSLDSLCRAHVSVADILCLSEDDDCDQVENQQFHEVGVGSSSSKQQVGDHSRILHCVMNPTAMKRSFSSGRFLFSRNKRGRSPQLAPESLT